MAAHNDTTSTTQGKDPQTRLEFLASATNTPIKAGHLRIPCPAHGGSDPNLELIPKDDYIAADCHSHQCTYPDIAAAILERYGVSLQPPPKPRAPKRREIASYDYLDADGNLLFQAVRYDPKSFSQRRPDPNDSGEWLWNLKGITTVPVPAPRSPSIRQKRSLDYRGEKDADRLRSNGLTATTNPMGAGKWRQQYSKSLKDRHVAIIPDEDGPGLVHLEKVAASLSGKAASVKVVHTAGAKDVSEWLDQDHTVEELLELLNLSPEWAPIDAPDDGAVTWDPDDTPKEVTRAAKLGRPAWYLIGLEYSERIRGGYLFVQDHREQTWWAYADNVWRPLPSTDSRIRRGFARDRYDFVAELYKAGKRDLAIATATDTGWDKNRTNTSDFWGGMEDGLRQPEPVPEQHHLGTPSGVVDLKSGKLLDHEPAMNIRGLTRGHFLPDAVDKHWGILAGRFANVFEEVVLQDLISLCALALTGLAQTHRALVLIVGPPGSGKGGAVNTVVRALGDRAMGVRSDWVERRGANEIDSTTAEALESQPAVIAIGELGGDTTLTQHRVLSLTGNEPLNARRPHGPNIYGTLQAQIWTTAVVPPKFDTGSGIERRLAVLPTRRPLEAHERNEAEGWDQDLFDALVTLAALQAVYVYPTGYTPPEGHSESRARVLRDMDHLAAWIEDLPDEMDGSPISEVLTLAQEELGWAKLNSTKLGTKVGTSAKWMKSRTRGDKIRIYLKDSPRGQIMMPY